MKFIIVLSLFFLFFSCNNSKNETKKDVLNERLDNEKNSAKSTFPTSDSITEINIPTDTFSVKIITTPNIGYGYQILNNNKLFINQPHIPSIQGNYGFESESKARITAEFIISKLEKGLFPPTISPSELDSLNVLPKL